MRTLFDPTVLDIHDPVEDIERAVIMGDDSASVTLVGASGLLPVMVRRVLATGTTATDIVGVY